MSRVLDSQTANGMEVVLLSMRRLAGMLAGGEDHHDEDDEANEGDRDGGENAKPDNDVSGMMQSTARSLISLVTNGSASMDALVVREMTPYLFKIWTDPIYRRPASSVDDNAEGQNNSLFLKLPREILARILTYLSDAEIAASASRLNRATRETLSSKLLMELMLKRVISREAISPAGVAFAVTISTSSRSLNGDGRLLDRDDFPGAGLWKREEELLRNLLRGLELCYRMFDVLKNSHVAEQYSQMEEDATRTITPLDATLRMIVRERRDFSDRLRALCKALTIRRRLHDAMRMLDALTSASRRLREGEDSVTLSHLLASCLSFGVSLNLDVDLQSCEKEEGPFGFHFSSSFFVLETITSRFSKEFTALDAVASIFLERVCGGDESLAKRRLDSLNGALEGFFHQAETHSLALVYVHGVLDDFNEEASRLIPDQTAEGDSFEAFWQRLVEVYRILKPLERRVSSRYVSTREEVARTTRFLLEGAEFHGIGREDEGPLSEDIRALLLNFVARCRERVKNCRERMELARRTALLEKAEVAQRAAMASARRLELLTGSSSEASPRHEQEDEATTRRRKEEFKANGRMVNSVLDSRERERRAREERMREMEAEIARAREGVSDTSESSGAQSGDARRELLSHMLRRRQLDERTDELTSDSRLLSDEGAEGEEVSPPPAPSRSMNNPDEEEEEEEEEEDRPSPNSTSLTSTSKKRTPLIVKPIQFKTWRWTTFSVPSDGSSPEGIWRVTWRWLHSSSSSHGDAGLLTFRLDREFRRLFSHGIDMSHANPNSAMKRSKEHFTMAHFSGESATVFKDNLTKDRLQRTAASVARLGPGIAPSSPPPSSTSTSAASSSVPTPALILPLARLLELKQSNKLQTVGIHEFDKLETHLGDEEFARVFKGMTKVQFYALAQWRRDKMKKEVGLF